MDFEEFFEQFEHPAELFTVTAKATFNVVIFMGSWTFDRIRDTFQKKE
jgi:hypothetical protein